MVVNLLAGRFAAVAPDIADREHLDILAPRVTPRHIRPGAAQEVATPLATHADKPHRDAFAGRHGAASAKRRGWDNGRGGKRGGQRSGGSAQEIAAADWGRG